MSLLVVAAALLFRTKSIPLSAVGDHWPVILNLLSGSLVGAWMAAGWATRVRGSLLYRVMAVLLGLIALALVFGHQPVAENSALMDGSVRVVVGAVAGLGIGIVASLMGVAGGELLIPTLVLLYGLDLKTAGSVALAVSLPTVLMGFARYSRDRSFTVIRRNRGFVIVMAAGSLLGAFIGGLLLGVVSADILLPTLAVILVISAAKIWRQS
jgi:uncharacterized membrane protein YfcA